MVDEVRLFYLCFEKLPNGRTVHDPVMLNVIADTYAARGAITRANDL
jgi:hypothetical protein